jgi:hypothetical protein
VDKVNNIGSMSLSSVPVYVPKTFLPDRPVIIETHIQNLAFTIKWIVNNARADLSNCVIYKSDDMENTRDIRLMQNVCSMSIEAVSAVVELTWTDTDVEADKKYYYRIVAVDIYNNISLPADLVEAFIIDTDLPEPPVFKHAAWILLDKADKTQTAWPNDNNIPAGKQAAIKLVFSAQKAGQQLFLMKKSRKTSFWQTIAQKNNFLLINKFDLQFIDTEVKPDTNYKYKIKVISAAGIPCLEYKLIELSRPLKDKKWITS